MLSSLLSRRLRLTWFLLPLAVWSCLPACTEPPEIHRVRGIYVAEQYNGLVAVINHESIPGVMESMEMGFTLENPAELQKVERGDKIAFDLLVRGEDWTIANLERLPEATELTLAELAPSRQQIQPVDSTTVDSVAIDDQP